MTDCKGSILQLNKKQAVIMTDECDFMTIKRRPGMFVGQQITYNKSDISHSKKFNMKTAALLASVFIFALCSIFYLQVYNPTAVYAYIDVDINPSLEFSIDEASRVISVTALNEDASTLIKGLELLDLPVKEAILKVVEASKDQGFIAVGKENDVLISASVNKKNKNIVDETNLDNFLQDIDNMDLGAEDIQSEIMKVTPQVRDSAVSNKISMGRYILYTKIKDKDNEITLEKAKTERVSDMLDEAKVKEKDKNDKNDKAVENKDKETGSIKKNTNNGNDKSKSNNSSSNNSSSNNKSNKSNNNTKKEQIDKDIGKKTDSSGTDKINNKDTVSPSESSDQNINDQGSNGNSGKNAAKESDTTNNSSKNNSTDNSAKNDSGNNSDNNSDNNSNNSSNSNSNSSSENNNADTKPDNNSDSKSDNNSNGNSENNSGKDGNKK